MFNSFKRSTSENEHKSIIETSRQILQNDRKLSLVGEIDLISKINKSPW